MSVYVTISLRVNVKMWLSTTCVINVSPRLSCGKTKDGEGLERSEAGYSIRIIGPGQAAVVSIQSSEWRDRSQAGFITNPTGEIETGLQPVVYRAPGPGQGS